MEEKLMPYLFGAFPKIPRLNRPMVVTEKIDGTNAQVVVADREEAEKPENMNKFWIFQDDYALLAGSRKRYLTVENDNFGFARWVTENAGQLIYLGLGTHYGEWWGQGIQRKYDMKRKIFSLFNTKKWKEERPDCCEVVPTLYEGPFNMDIINMCVYSLKARGSVAAPGFMRPEGVVVYHTHSNHLFKVTCTNDEVPKGRI